MLHKRNKNSKNAEWIDFHMTQGTDSFSSAATWKRYPPRLRIENTVKLYKRIKSTSNPIRCTPFSSENTQR